MDDISNIKSKDIPNADVLVAGFPCQPFSIAGYRKGFEDERGNTFFQLARVIRDKKPKVIFIENVVPGDIVNVHAVIIGIKRCIIMDQGSVFRRKNRLICAINHQRDHDQLYEFLLCFHCFPLPYL